MIIAIIFPNVIVVAAVAYTTRVIAFYSVVINRLQLLFFTINFDSYSSSITEANGY